MTRHRFFPPRLVAAPGPARPVGALQYGRDFDFSLLCRQVKAEAAEEKRRGLSPAVEADLRVAVEYLSQLKSVKRIWLFGSIAKGRLPDWRSDLDLAVEGLPVAELGRVWSELDARLRLPLDLVCWETAGETLCGEVQRWGWVIYER